MKKIIFFLLVGLCPVFCSAQDADNARFEMIKATINFLAKDSRISKDTKFSLTCSSDKLKERYSCLENSITDKVFQGKDALLAKVQKWDSKKAGNSQSDLNGLKTTLIDDIASKSKEYRSKLPQFNEYKATLDQLAKSVKTTAGETPPAATPAQTVSKPAGHSSNDIELQQLQTSVANMQVQIDSLSKKIKPAPIVNTSNKFVDYAAVVLAVIGIIIGFLAYKRKAPGTKNEMPTGFSNEGGISPEELKHVREELTSKITTLREGVQTLETKLNANAQSIQNILTEQTNQPREIVFDNISNRKQNPRGQEPTTQTYTGGNAGNSAVMYAKFIDIDGGFSAGMLKETQNGEMVFEISIIGGHAAYGVSADPRAQRYALQNFEYLDAACNVKGTPQSNGKIVTLKQGALSQSPEGNWIIVDKADIELQ